MTIANDQENPDPRQVVYTDFQILEAHISETVRATKLKFCVQRDMA